MVNLRFLLCAMIRIRDQHTTCWMTKLKAQRLVKARKCANSQNQFQCTIMVSIFLQTSFSNNGNSVKIFTFSNFPSPRLDATCRENPLLIYFLIHLISIFSEHLYLSTYFYVNFYSKRVCLDWIWRNVLLKLHFILKWLHVFP